VEEVRGVTTLEDFNETCESRDHATAYLCLLPDFSIVFFCREPESRPAAPTFSAWARFSRDVRPRSPPRCGNGTLALQLRKRTAPSSGTCAAAAGDHRRRRRVPEGRERYYFVGFFLRVGLQGCAARRPTYPFFSFRIFFKIAKNGLTFKKVMKNYILYPSPLTI
jgi:hypothetical protein